uniref:C1q domain-containing protein n=1 Tax=uncultured marine virus TaxID=186617 RepID=A0A0F7L8L8_9VIRU|nr:hypothetical protein [uncultured marine virus]
MSLLSNDRIDQFTAVGGETTIAHTFPVTAAADIVVKRNVSGTITSLTLTTDYTVPDIGVTAGGDIAMAGSFAAGLDAGDEFTLFGNQVVTRAASSDFSNGGDFFAATINTQLDDLTQIAQDARRDIDLSVKKDPAILDTLDPLLPALTDRRAIIVNEVSSGVFSLVMSTNDPDEQATDAAASAAAALASETAAAASETAAGTSETNAGTSETNAAASAAAAAASAAGIRWKDRVITSTTANITLSGEQTLDGVLTSASRVLVKDQTAPAENGVYVSAAGAWARATDADIWDEIPSLAVAVEQGTANGDKLYICTSDSGGTLETTAITFVVFGSGGLVNVVEDLSPELGGPLIPGSFFVGRTKGADIASASPLVALTDGDYNDVTGTTGFSAVTVAANRSGVFQFDGILTITVGAGITLNNAGGNYTTAAGDLLIWQSTATDTIVGFIIKADGTAVVSASGTPSITDNGDTEALIISSDEEITMPLQPMFSAYVTTTVSNVTGDTTDYSLGTSIWTEISDIASNFASGIFTAPVSGTYLFTGKIGTANMTSTSTSLNLYLSSSNRLYRMWYTTDWIRNASQDVTPFSQIVDMDAGDTAFLRIKSGGLTKVVDIAGGSQSQFTNFAGFLLG